MLTYDCGTLEDRRTPVEDKDRFYSPEEKLADTTQEAKDVSVKDHTPLIVSHCGLELVDPYTRIYCEDFSLQSLQTVERKSEKARKSSAIRKKYSTGRPTGASNFQRDFTPMVVR